MNTSLTAALGLGLLLGLRHALDADHVAAVSTLVSQHRSLARSCLLGAFWGAGHTMALLAAGVGVIAFRLTISPAMEKGLETVVALVLILLGGHVLLRSLGTWTLHGHEHSHDGYSHRHLHVHVGSEDSPGHTVGELLLRAVASLALAGLSLGGPPLQLSSSLFPETEPEPGVEAAA